MDETAHDAGKLSVFISYSRRDCLDFADQLTKALDAFGYQPIIDREDISGGEEWIDRLGEMILEADTVVFVLSPEAANSPVCAWEVEEAIKLGKRILPVIALPLEGRVTHERLQRLNFIHFYNEKSVPGSGYGHGLQKLNAALKSDLDWLRQHRDVLVRAIAWQVKGSDSDRLLRGSALAEAERWATSRPITAPDLVDIQRTYLAASRAAEDEEAAARARVLAERERLLAESEAAQRREVIAQADREMAQQAALTQAEYARTQAELVARRTAIGLIASLILTLAASSLGFIAWTKENEARLQARLADNQREVAEQQKLKAQYLLGAASDLILHLSNRYALDAETHSKARKIFASGAEMDNPVSLNSLGYYNQKGLGGKSDIVAARVLYERATAMGHTRAIRNLALMYYDGLGVGKDVTKARELYAQAAERGDAGAMNNLGIIFEEDEPRDYEKAVHWYSMAANGGDVNAIVNLGLLYSRLDKAKAHEWLLEAAGKLKNMADRGDALAMREVAVNYLLGRGVEQNFAGAVEWFEKAAKRGETGSMLQLAKMYETAHGVQQNLETAKAWRERATIVGNLAAATTEPDEPLPGGIE